MDKFLIRIKKSEEPSQDCSSHCESTNKNTCQQLSTVSTTSKSTTTTDVALIRSGRAFQEKWKQTYAWLIYDSQLEKAFCSICKKAVEIKASLPQSANDLRTKKAFVEDGFRTWNKSLERFKAHEKSEFHRAAILVWKALERGTNIELFMSKSKIKEMEDARICLKIICSTVRYLAVQGMALRGHTDENSNFRQLVQLRADDVPQLKSWLARSKYKWLSHDIINEILSLFSINVQQQLRQRVANQKYFAILADETSDISTSEQMVICFRTVDKNLEVEENVFGLYETSFTNSETLYKIIRDVLLRHSFDIANCRGQCYDGAANVSGSNSGLQKRVLNDEPRAIYVHCNAHNLNLVVQDSFQKIGIVRDFLALIKDLINFVKDSPKRLGIFKSLQLQEHEDSKNLRPFCPTRWCVRIRSLQSVLKNYAILQKIFHQLGAESNESGAKANGFEEKMSAFQTYFLLQLLIFVFERIEVLNTDLQRQDLHFCEAKKKIECLRDSLQESRNNGYDSLWQSVEIQIRELEIEDPVLPRRRKIPKRLDDMAEIHHNFESPKDYYRQIYYEVIDLTISRLAERNHKEISEHLELMESFAIGRISSVDRVAEVYKDDFDASRLTLHRDMFLDMASQKNKKIESFADVLDFLKNYREIGELLTEYTNFVRIILTIPVTTCTAERSFSCLRRLKSYLRSTMTQKRLNDIMLINIHRDMTENVNLNQLCDEFIRKAPIRMSTFALGSS